MIGIHRTQFDHSCIDLLSLAIWSRVFWRGGQVKALHIPFISMFGYLHQMRAVTLLFWNYYFTSRLFSDKAAACATLRAAFDTQPQNWTLLDCNIECCTGHNCNNQNVTVVPPTAASTPTPSTPTSEPHGNSCCNMSKTRARMKPEFLTSLLKWNYKKLCSDVFSLVLHCFHELC